MKFIDVNDIPYDEYVKNFPPYILELQDNTNGIHSSWMDQGYRDRNKNGGFDNCVMGLMPSMVLAPKIQYKYNNKIYDQIDCIFSCPGTGASLMVFRKPQ